MSDLHKPEHSGNDIRSVRFDAIIRLSYATGQGCRFLTSSPSHVNVLEKNPRQQMQRWIDKCISHLARSSFYKTTCLVRVSRQFCDVLEGSSKNSHFIRQTMC